MPNRIRSLTEDQVIKFANDLSRLYGFKIEKKSNSFMIKLIGGVLSKITDMSAKDFINSHATTLFNTVYVPFQVGTPYIYNGMTWDLEEQVRILMHEAVHVLQYRTDKTMPVRYLATLGDRIMYEGEAYSAEIEYLTMQFANYGDDKAVESDMENVVGKLIQRYENSINTYIDKRNASKAINAKAMFVAKLQSDGAMIMQGIPISPVVGNTIGLLRRLGSWRD